MTWPSGVAAITLFVEDLAAARHFYLEVFGLEAAFEDDTSVAFKFGETMVNLLDVAASRELIQPASAAGPADGVRMVISLDVEDVDATCEHLAAQGVELLNGPMDRPWGIRTASFRDPAGHIWEIAHSLAPS
jgi:catechol 2,3-dioxygenase-like lactoylglutathione lyase family enzyme